MIFKSRKHYFSLYFPFNYLKWTLMDINSLCCIGLYLIYSFYGISGDVYDRLHYETHATDKTKRYVQKRGYNINYKNTMVEVICILNGQ